MKPITNPDLDRLAMPLGKALGKSEELKDLVDEAADELSSVSAVLREEVSDRGSPPGIGNALEKTESAEDMVQGAADKLSEVHLALKEEVLERDALEFRLAAVTEQAEASRNAAFHDPLTGLPNRSLFNDRLDHGLAQAKRHGRNLAVMFIDLDDFERVNDSYGHDAGDAVLKTIAARLRANTRNDDTIGRHGGDDFLYLLADFENEQTLAVIAEKLLASIQLPCSVTVDSVSINPCFNASIGIAVYPKDGTTAQALIKSADKALYMAKESRSSHRFAH